MTATVDTAHSARDQRLRALSLGAAVTLAADPDACRALLHGTPVPVRRLDQSVVRALDLEPGVDVVLDLELVERVALLAPNPVVHVCPRCRHRWEP